jgi:N-formylglutamate deformylase
LGKVIKYSMSNNELKTFSFYEGNSPLLVSIPHDGRLLSDDINKLFKEKFLELPDTDWHMNRLYESFKDTQWNIISANFSRYVVDLNRSSDGTKLYKDYQSTGLCPIKSFSGEHLYSDDNEISELTIKRRVESYWKPYHDKIKQILESIKSKYGYAILWDAHSIKSRIPNLFEGELPNLNIGTNSGESCPNSITESIDKVANDSGFSVVINDRFKGGYITRHYGKPAENVFAIQMEIAQRTYMNELTLSYDERLSKKLTPILKLMLDTFIVNSAEYFKER